MGWAGIPLGVATSMFAAMTLGIGVNCAIHLLEGFHQARPRVHHDEAALNTALQLTGPPALDQHAGHVIGFRRADALASASERAARLAAGAWAGQLLRLFNTDAASVVELVADKMSAIQQRVPSCLTTQQHLDHTKRIGNH